jgi:predicted LPLAT superfamily acyltransferase
LLERKGWEKENKGKLQSEEVPLLEIIKDVGSRLFALMYQKQTVVFLIINAQERKAMRRAFTLLRQRYQQEQPTGGRQKALEHLTNCRLLLQKALPI